MSAEKTFGAECSVGVIEFVFVIVLKPFTEVIRTNEMKPRTLEWKREMCGEPQVGLAWGLVSIGASSIMVRG